MNDGEDRASDLLDLRFMLFTGKGGVGKTTVVAGVAVEAARRGRRPAFDDSSGAARGHTMAVADGALLDLSGLTGLTLPFRIEDFVELDLSGGGSADLSSLANVPGAGGRLVFDVHAGSTLNLPALTTVEDT